MPIITSEAIRLTTSPTRVHKHPSGIALDSVTSILDIVAKRELMEWYGTKGIAEARRIGDEARNDGKLVDNIVGRLLTGHVIGEWATLTPKVQQHIRAFERWRDDYRPFELLGLQQEVYSLSLGYSGQIDFRIKWKGLHIIVDTKAVNDLYVVYKMQLAAYERAVQETTGEAVDELWLLRLDKGGEYYLYRWADKEDRAAALGAFLNFKEGRAYAIKGLPDKLKTTSNTIDDLRYEASISGSPIKYLPDYPRVMTAAEEKKIYGKVDDTYICAIVKIKDLDGNAAVGYGRWPKDAKIIGAEHGNTAYNVAFVKAEKNALQKIKPEITKEG